MKDSTKVMSTNDGFGLPITCLAIMLPVCSTMVITTTFSHT